MNTTLPKGFRSQVHVGGAYARPSCYLACVVRT